MLDVTRQQGEVAVLADPALVVSTDELVNCESVLLERASGWLFPRQNASLFRVVLAYRSGDYSGMFKLAPKTPPGNGHAISNIRVQPHHRGNGLFGVQHRRRRAAGVHVRAARAVQGRPIREGQPAASNAHAVRRARAQVSPKDPKKLEAITGRAVSVWLELQDQAHGRLQVIVEHDRLRAEAARTRRRCRCSKRGRFRGGSWCWRTPAATSWWWNRRTASSRSSGGSEAGRSWPVCWGENITGAYVSRENAGLRRLAYPLKQRAAVETAAAKIGLAETDLLVDGNGAYRGVTHFRMNNRTEQFLEIELPARAELWTARVAGTAVKPTVIPGAASDGPMRRAAGEDRRGG